MRAALLHGLACRQHQGDGRITTLCRCCSGVVPSVWFATFCVFAIARCTGAGRGMTSARPILFTATAEIHIDPISSTPARRRYQDCLARRQGSARLAFTIFLPTLFSLDLPCLAACGFCKPSRQLCRFVSLARVPVPSVCCSAVPRKRVDRDGRGAMGETARDHRSRREQLLF